MKRSSRIIEVIAIIILAVSWVILSFYRTYYKVSILLWEILLIPLAVMKFKDWINQKKVVDIDNINLNDKVSLDGILKHKKSRMARVETLGLLGYFVVAQIISINFLFDLDLDLDWVILPIGSIALVYGVIQYLTQLSWSSTYMLVQDQSNETIDASIKEFGYKERYTYDFLIYEGKTIFFTLIFWGYLKQSFNAIGLAILVGLFLLLIVFIQYARNKSANEIREKL